MTIPDDSPGFRLTRACAFLMRRVCSRKIAPDKTKPKDVQPKSKHRSHRTTTFFEMP
jgi:hypothetical protein